MLRLEGVSGGIRGTQIVPSALEQSLNMPRTSSAICVSLTTCPEGALRSMGGAYGVNENWLALDATSAAELAFELDQTAEAS
jgi:hypothetical protein